MRTAIKIASGTKVCMSLGYKRNLCRAKYGTDDERLRIAMHLFLYGKDVGTVISHQSKFDWVIVEWSNGNLYNYYPKSLDIVQ